jgi:hypothetical protein
MAVLRETTTKRTIPLEPEHVVGRASICTLRIPNGFVSSQHAMIRYDGRGWVLRDLASVNGTWLDGQRVPAGEERALRTGSRVAFGKEEAEWEMIADSPPVAMVVPLNGDPPIVIEGDLLPLPSAEDPAAIVYRSLGDSWMLEEGDTPPVPLADLQVFHCGGRAWRFSWPGNVLATTRVEVPAGAIHLRDLALEFRVSLNEEHVLLRVRRRGRMIDFGEHAYHYLLLTLARARLEDAKRGVPESSCGWVDAETLCRSVATTRTQVGVDVFRNRKQLVEAGVIEATGIIERRPGELRIGVADITITRE